MNYSINFYIRNFKYQIVLARKLVPWLVKNLKFNSIIDFGCGCGHFLALLSKTAKIKNYLGLNLNIPGILCIPRDKLYIHDFMIGLDLKEKYDLVISLEVAEHIPAKFADIFIYSLVRHTSKYILFSAAIPGQGGVGHVNEQPHQFWHKQFLKHGFKIQDKIRPILKDDKTVPFWYRNNIFLYVKQK